MHIIDHLRRYLAIQSFKKKSYALIMLMAKGARLGGRKSLYTLPDKLISTSERQHDLLGTLGFVFPRKCFPSSRVGGAGGGRLLSPRRPQRARQALPRILNQQSATGVFMRPFMEPTRAPGESTPGGSSYLFKDLFSEVQKTSLHTVCVLKKK